MTDIQRFNLLWLCYAMTAPVSAVESYYYDGESKRFFIQKPDGLLDMLELPLAAPESERLLKGLAAIDSERSVMVEIPRLNVQDKLAVQLLFLSGYPTIAQTEALRLAVERQEDAYGFALDQLVEQFDFVEAIPVYWEDFKLKTIHYYLEKFTGVIGITWKMI